MQIIGQETVYCGVDGHGRVMHPFAVVRVLQVHQTHVPDLFQHNESHRQQTCSDQVANLQRDLCIY